MEFINIQELDIIKKGMTKMDIIGMVLIKLDQEFVKIKPSSAKCLTESALKVLFCHLFNLADNGNICLKSLRNQELDAQFRNYLKDEKGEEI